MPSAPSSCCTFTASGNTSSPLGSARPTCRGAEVPAPAGEHQRDGLPGAAVLRSARGIAARSRAADEPAESVWRHRRPGAAPVPGTGAVEQSQGNSTVLPLPESTSNGASPDMAASFYNGNVPQTPDSAIFNPNYLPSNSAMADLTSWGQFDSLVTAGIGIFDGGFQETTILGLGSICKLGYYGQAW